jgi:hypothetical protein
VPLHRFHCLGRDKIKEQRLTHKIYVDATRPATLNDGAGLQTDCPTLGEAVTAWQRLPPECGVFNEALDQFYGGKPDPRTLELVHSR